MPSQFYGYSTNLPVISSDGSLPTDYEKPWDLKNFNPWISDKPVHPLAINVTSVVPEISFFIGGETEVIIKKLIGFYLLAYMPDGGLDEALFSLKDIFEFNLEKASYQFPEPPEILVRRGIVSKVSESPV